MPNIRHLRNVVFACRWPLPEGNFSVVIRFAVCRLAVGQVTFLVFSTTEATLIASGLA